MRTHVVLPDGIVPAIDKLVGKGNRSKFIEEAVQEKLRKDNLLKALQESFGILRDEDYPEWSTSEKVAKWVHDMRQRDTQIREKRLRSD